MEDTQSSSSAEPLLTAEAVNALSWSFVLFLIIENDIESKEKEIKELKEIQLKLNIQLQTVVEESNNVCSIKWY